MTNDWKKSRDRRLVVLSATQVETWNLCKRKWWLAQVRRLPKVGTKSQAFGTVLHAVCERFLNADDRGYDPKTGEPADLYPEGWHKAVSRFTGESEGECSPAEQDLIKQLIARAIEEGVLERRPGRAVEKEFRRTIIHLECPTCLGSGQQCPDCPGDGKGTHFQITGFIDLSYRDEVQDHKTTKAIRWAKSAEALKKNPQMLIYAKALLEDIKDQGGALPEEIILRHNVYVKDPDAPRIRKTEVSVTVEEIEHHWNQVIQSTEEMDRYRRMAEEWTDLPDPPNPSEACNAYGGCEYRSICSGKESEIGYERRLARHNQTGYNESSTPLKGESKMNFAAKLAEKKAQMAQSQGVAPAAAPAPAKPALNPLAGKAPAPALAPASDEKTVQIGRFKCRVWGKAADGSDLLLPPWAVPGVQVNGGIGFNQHGEPDRISAIKAKAAGLPTPEMFELTPVGDGTIYWEGKNGTPAEGMSGLSPLSPNYEPGAEIPVQEKVDLSPAEKEHERKLEGSPDEDDGTETPETPEPSTLAEAISGTPTRGRGRPPKKFTLLINCAATSGIEKPGSGRHVYNLHEIMQKIGDLMAKEAGAASFYDLDAFSRRDALASKAEQLANEVFANDIVSACGIGSGMSDLKALVDALRPFAGMVIVAEG